MNFLNYKNNVIRLNTISRIPTNKISNTRYSVIPDTSSLNQRSRVIDFNARILNCHSDEQLYLCLETHNNVIILLGWHLCVFCYCYFYLFGSSYSIGEFKMCHVERWHIQTQTILPRLNAIVWTKILFFLTFFGYGITITFFIILYVLYLHS